MNIFERLYNKIFHNKALIKENELEREMISALEGSIKDSLLSASQKAKEMVDYVEEYLGKIVKNRGNLWTGRNKVSKFLDRIKKIHFVVGKVSYLAEITKDKEFGGSYWAQKIGPIFSEVGKSLREYNEIEKKHLELLKRCDVASALEWLSIRGRGRISAKKLDYKLDYDYTVLGDVVRYYMNFCDLTEDCYSYVIRHIESYILCLICEIGGIGDIGRDFDDDLWKLGCGYEWHKRFTLDKIASCVNFYHGKCHEICKWVISLDPNSLEFDSYSEYRKNLEIFFGFWSEPDIYKKSVIDELWSMEDEKRRLSAEELGQNIGS